jgi:hypothetical protein
MRGCAALPSLTDADGYRTRPCTTLRTPAAQTVVGDEFCVVPERRGTGCPACPVALSIHTWPEFALANVDLLSYGEVRGEVVLASIVKRSTWSVRGHVRGTSFD